MLWNLSVCLDHVISFFILISFDFDVFRCMYFCVTHLIGNTGCRPGQFVCGDGKCVDASAICDGQYDCIDAADERDCSK